MFDIQKKDDIQLNLTADVDNLVQDSSKTSVVALELSHSCAKPLIYWWVSARKKHLQCVRNGVTFLLH